METRPLKALAVLLLGTLAAAAWPCEHSPRPPCGRTAWLSVSTPKTLVHPGDATDILVDVVLVPYVDWNTGSGCAQPQSVTLSLSMNCTPSDGGDPIQVGPSLVPIGNATIPGVQPLMTGTGMVYTFTIPAGTLPSGLTYRCAVFGSLNVTFGAGIGSGTIAGFGSAALCIAEPSPANAAFPRLGLCRLNLGDDGFLRCRKGDQGLHFYAITNNDPTEGVAFEFSTRSNQLAKTPVNTDPTTTFAISSDKPDRDNFPLRFADLFDQGQFVPLGDPTKKDTQEISRSIYLGPGDTRVVPVLVRSHGMCANGSCCQLRAEVAGTFDDGTPALACASTAILVEDVPAKTPLFEIFDQVKAGDTTDVLWSRTTFDGNDHLATLAGGNLFENEGGPGTQTTGSSLPQTADYPPTAEDFIRNEDAFDKFTYVVEAFPMAENFARQKTRVIVNGFAGSDGNLTVPVFKRPNPTNFKLVIDVADDAAKLFDLDEKKSKQLIFNGAWSTLVITPPAGVFLETSTCRTFTRVDVPAGDYLCAFPPASGFTFDDASTPDDLSIDVFDPRLFDSPLAWTASTDDLAAVPAFAMGNAGQSIQVQFDLTHVPSFPDSGLTILSIQSTNAFNDRILVPLVTRKRNGVPLIGDLDVSQFTGKLFFNKNDKDKLTIQGTIPIEQGFDPKDQIAAFSIGSLDLVFTLDKNGKAKEKTQSLEIDLKKKNGVVQAGDRLFVLTVKSTDLSGLFSSYGARPDAPKGVPFLADVPVLGRLFANHTVQSTQASLLVVVTPKLATLALEDG